MHSAARPTRRPSGSRHCPWTSPECWTTSVLVADDEREVQQSDRPRAFDVAEGSEDGVDRDVGPEPDDERLDRAELEPDHRQDRPARAFVLIWSNSGCVIVPASRSVRALAISSDGEVPATWRM